MAKQTLTYNSTSGNWELTETEQGKTYTNTLLTNNKNISGDIKLSITAKSGTVGVTTTQPNTTTYPVQITITPTTSDKYLKEDEGYINNGQIVIGAIQTETKTQAPSTSTITLTPTSGKYFSKVTISAITVGTAGTPTLTQTSGTNKVTIQPKVTNVEGYISSETISGTAITITASDLVTQGTQTITQQNGTNVTNWQYADVRSATTNVSLSSSTVSNNQITITPSVTVSQSGWIESGKTGTSITVKASDLVSGSTPITSNGTYNITNYASVEVNVPQGITPTGNITITKQSGTDVTNYASADVRAASSFSLNATDNTGVVTVGSLASGYYPLTNSITASLSAGTPGWFSSGSANDSSVQVGKIAAATPTSEVSSLSSPTITITKSANGFTASTQTTSYYVDVTASQTKGSVKSKYKNSNAGYAPANTSGTESGATEISATYSGTGKIYIPEGNAVPTVDSLSAPTVAISGSASGMATATNGTYYVEITGSGTNGSVKAKVTKTGGMIESGNTTSSASTITPNITGSGSKVYIQAGNVTPEVNSLSSPTVAVSGTANGMVTATLSDYYVEITGTGTNGSVKAKETRVAGYVEAGNSTSNATTITPNITGSGDKVYIQALNLPQATTSTAPSGATLIQTIGRSTSTRRILIPAGYHNGNEYYQISSVANGSMAVATTTSYSTVVATVTPSTSNQYVNYSAGYTTSRYVQINGDSNLVGSNIVSGVSIFGVTGTYIPASGTVTSSSSSSGTNTGVTITPSTSTQYVNISEGYLPSSYVKINAVTAWTGTYS